MAMSNEALERITPVNPPIVKRAKTTKYQVFFVVVGNYSIISQIFQHFLYNLSELIYFLIVALSHLPSIFLI